MPTATANPRSRPWAGHAWMMLEFGVIVLPIGVALFFAFA